MYITRFRRYGRVRHAWKPNNKTHFHPATVCPAVWTTFWRRRRRWRRSRRARHGRKCTQSAYLTAMDYNLRSGTCCAAFVARALHTTDVDDDREPMWRMTVSPGVSGCWRASTTGRLVLGNTRTRVRTKNRFCAIYPNPGHCFVRFHALVNPASLNHNLFFFQ